jgi:hypothetical protein
MLGAGKESRAFTVLVRAAIPMIICHSSTALRGPLLSLYPVLVLIGHFLINYHLFSRILFGFRICYWAQSREKASVPSVSEEKLCRRCIALSGCFAARSCLEIVRSLSVVAIADSGFDSRADVMRWVDRFRCILRIFDSRR